MSFGKKFVSCTVFGAKDAGKSTLIGKLMHRVGAMNDRDLYWLQKESLETTGSEDSGYAFFCDRAKLERISKQTIYNYTREFYTNSYQIAITDTPGNIKYKSEKIRAISLADFGIMVISTKDKSGLDNNTIDSRDKKQIYHMVTSFWVRQYKLKSFPTSLYSIIALYIVSDQFDDAFFDNLLICNTLGIKEIIICVNKLDLINYDKNTYQGIKKSAEIAIQQF